MFNILDMGTDKNCIDICPLFFAGKLLPALQFEKRHGEFDWGSIIRDCIEFTGQISYTDKSIRLAYLTWLLDIYETAVLLQLGAKPDSTLLTLADFAAVFIMLPKESQSKLRNNSAKLKLTIPRNRKITISTGIRNYSYTDFTDGATATRFYLPVYVHPYFSKAATAVS
jgi:hypothetical protein